MYSRWSFVKNKSQQNEQDFYRPEGIYFSRMTCGLYIILLSMLLLGKVRKYIPPKSIFFNDFAAVSWLPLRKKIAFQANRTLKFQELRSNILLADFKLEWISVMTSERFTFKMIWKMWIRSTKPVISGHYSFSAVIVKKYRTSERSATFWGAVF